jgi:hypothetical protein
MAAYRLPPCLRRFAKSPGAIWESGNPIEEAGYRPRKRGLAGFGARLRARARLSAL